MSVNLEMDTSVFSNQCKIRQCSQCQGDVEFYCNTCKHNLCIQCKEKHVIDLDTIYHDVVFYREKNDYIQKQETCVRHPDMVYRRYCNSCKIPVCFKCREHLKHKLQDLISAYKKYRQQYRETIDNIRSETLYNSCVLLDGIKTDLKIVHKEIFNSQSEMSTKAARLKKIIDTVICDAKIGYRTYLHRFLILKRKINAHHVIIENYEYLFELSAYRPVRFLLFLKKTRVPKKKDSPDLTQYALLSLTEEISIKVVIKLLNEFQMMDRRKRQVRNECVLKLMSTPVFHKYVTVTSASSVTHISRATSDRFWTSDDKNLILINTEGKDHQIKKLSKDDRTKISFIKNTKSWDPQCVYCSPSNGDLLVGMWNTRTFKEGKVTRYNKMGQDIQTIQHNNTGKVLYMHPRYITENLNGDVIVCDFYRAVVVTKRGGGYRFSYKGPSSELPMTPYGICTDALSNILVCERFTSTIHMIDKDGCFLSMIETYEQGIDNLCCLSYDYKTHLLWDSSPVYEATYDGEKFVQLLLIAFSKAFYHINHNMLLGKKGNNGVQPEAFCPTINNK
ncbi:uncharacterized protein LOC133194306 [Saccostrea echinata]|uniref:uncharacterized protein LOC133194306 n=1 Tax=Saccostrea echinata TaxID=191078 RepID=UPI002A8187EE|nr:uncharacterized protein LOC133194306 [Saccostrea echinata]